jgi:protein-S-isoprenylcysteine O-methyltransferase Ste14
LFKRGKPAGQWEDTSQLVTTGIYRYLRHPLYVSLVCVGFGAMLKDPGIIQITLSLVNLLSLYLTARVEEKEMVDKFGEAYKNYLMRSYLLIPYIL